jgi:hypothetical protein
MAYDGKSRSEKRADWFTGFNREAMAREAWIISSPGASEIIIETLPGNPWIDELTGRGFSLQWEGNGQRIVSHYYSEPMTLSSSGAMMPLTPGSTREVTMVRREPGIARTERFSFRAPR